MRSGEAGRHDVLHRAVPPIGWAEIEFEEGYRRARLVTLAALGIMFVSSVAMPVIGIGVEQRLTRQLLGAVGIAAFSAGLGWALVDEFRPGLSYRRRHLSSSALLGAAIVSVPLVGPLGAESGRWESWAWLGAALIGAVPLLVRGVPAASAAVVLTVAVSAAVGWANDGAVVEYVLITAGIGASLALINGLQIGLWRLVVQARDGQDALARLAVSEERLRFARDVHDLLGHDLSVIALKAELAKRLAPIDAERSGEQAAEIQRLATSALAQVRQTVHGYRAVDLHDQIAAVEQVLRSAGVRCVVRLPDRDLPAEASHLVPVLREAVTNVLRHSRAARCTIDVDTPPEQVRMVVTNDGVVRAAPDRYSGGLRGLSDRLAEVDGTVSVDAQAGTFTLTARVPVPA
ncbi:sensor histidine kinase [Pseudonocardia xinjiangensis]|uniref:sensor histidine kinase n=1 Tax=Pseudonocardia xinjiangensis TaxID=75289 RepID=UPI003D8CC2DA